jgi:hypothetical protein
MSTTSTTIVTVNTLSSATITVSDSIDFSISITTSSERFVKTETIISTFQPLDSEIGSTSTVKVRSETSVLNYYPNIIVNPSVAPKLFQFIENHYNLRDTITGPLDATKIHVFRNYDSIIPREVYNDELGISPFDGDTPIDSALWFTKALPGWRSGILRYDWHWLTPVWNDTANPDPLKIPLRTRGPHLDASSIFVPLRGCENLRMEIYEPLLAPQQLNDFGSSAKMNISEAKETRETYPALIPSRANLIKTVTFEQAFSFDIVNNWVQFVNTGSTHALWLEIIGGTEGLMTYGTNFWIGNAQDEGL